VFGQFLYLYIFGDSFVDSEMGINLSGLYRACCRDLVNHTPYSIVLTYEAIKKLEPQFKKNNISYPNQNSKKLGILNKNRIFGKYFDNMLHYLSVSTVCSKPTFCQYSCLPLKLLIV
jgi:hypothetical protein